MYGGGPNGHEQVPIVHADLLYEHGEEVYL